MKLPRLTLFLVAGACWPALLSAEELQPTVIDSEQLDMHSTDTPANTLTTFVFSRNVVVTGTNLRLTCDRLEVITTRKVDPTTTIGKQGRFKSLIAEGSVHIVQSDREVACGRAEVLPDEDKIILTDNPVVKDLANNAVATGPRMVLYRGERRAVIEGAAAAPSRIILPAIKDLGFTKEPAPATPPAEPAQKP